MEYFVHQLVLSIASLDGRARDISRHHLAALCATSCFGSVSGFCADLCAGLRIGRTLRSAGMAKLPRDLRIAARDIVVRAKHARLVALLDRSDRGFVFGRVLALCIWLISHDCLNPPALVCFAPVHLAASCATRVSARGLAKQTQKAY